MNAICNTHRSYRARQDGLLRKLVPEQEHVQFLNECRRKVRSCLKTGLRDFINMYDTEGPDPKFRIQGSWAYGLCNLPAYDHQELDLDYGVYLSSSIFKDDTQYSKKTLKQYFDEVESLVSVLAEDEGWTVDANDNCVRLIIGKNSHLDVPVYIVPASMFDDLEENSQLQTGVKLAAATASFESRGMYDSASYADLAMDGTSIFESYRMDFEAKFKDHIDLENITRITMAKRDGDYRASDCEQVRKWFSDFLESQEDKGTQLRYICRYLKAWRDWHWKEGGGPSSILLMVISCQNYSFISDRDDLALLAILKRLPEALKGTVKEIRIPDHEDEDFNRIKPEDRQFCSTKAANFFSLITDALSEEQAKYCIDKHILAFGNRFPNNAEYVKVVPIDPEGAIFAQPAVVGSHAKLPPSVTSG